MDPWIAANSLKHASKKEFTARKHSNIRVVRPENIFFLFNEVSLVSCKVPDIKYVVK